MKSLGACGLSSLANKYDSRVRSSGDQRRVGDAPEDGVLDGVLSYCPPRVGKRSPDINSGELRDEPAKQRCILPPWSRDSRNSPELDAVAALLSAVRSRTKFISLAVSEMPDCRSSDSVINGPYVMDLTGSINEEQRVAQSLVKPAANSSSESDAGLFTEPLSNGGDQKSLLMTMDESEKGLANGTVGAHFTKQLTTKVFSEPFDEYVNELEDILGELECDRDEAIDRADLGYMDKELRDVAVGKLQYQPIFLPLGADQRCRRLELIQKLNNPAPLLSACVSNASGEVVGYDLSKLGLSCTLNDDQVGACLHALNDLVTDESAHSSVQSLGFDIHALIEKIEQALSDSESTKVFVTPFVPALVDEVYSAITASLKGSDSVLVRAKVPINLEGNGGTVHVWGLDLTECPFVVSTDHKTMTSLYTDAVKDCNQLSESTFQRWDDNAIALAEMDEFLGDVRSTFDDTHPSLG